MKALIRTGDEYGYGMELLKAVERVNERQKTVLFDKIQKHYEGNVKGKHFGLWGLSFKPATDDMREAPSLVLIGQLLEAGATSKLSIRLQWKKPSAGWATVSGTLPICTTL